MDSVKQGSVNQEGVQREAGHGRSGAEQLYQALGEVDDDLLSAELPAVPRRRKGRTIRSWGLAAACLCLLIGGGWLLSEHRDAYGSTDALVDAAKPGLPDSNQAGADLAVTNEGQLDESGRDFDTQIQDAAPPAEDADNDGKANATAPLIISDFDSGQLFDDYVSPQNGTYFCHIPLQTALDEQAASAAAADKTVYYFVAIDIFADETQLAADDERLLAELARLRELGCEVGLARAWTYRNQAEQVFYTYPAGIFTAQQLADFPAAADRGYAFHFQYNGDGSPVEPRLLPWAD